MKIGDSPSLMGNKLGERLDFFYNLNFRRQKMECGEKSWKTEKKIMFKDTSTIFTVLKLSQHVCYCLLGLCDSFSLPV